jgi:hypothetical protein
VALPDAPHPAITGLIRPIWAAQLSNRVPASKEAAMDDDEERTPTDIELAELESADLSDIEVQDIKRSQQEPDTPAADDPEVG